MSGEKTHAPTQKRLDDARKRGEVSQSKDLPVLAKYAVFSLVLMLGFEPLWQRLQELISLCIIFSQSSGSQSVDGLIREAAITSAWLAASLVASVVVAGVCGVMVQVGFLFSSEAVTPSLKKLNVVQNVAQLFSAQTLTQLLLSLLKVSLYIACAVWWLISILGDTLKLQMMDLLSIRLFTVTEIRHLLMLSVAVFLVFALLDWVITRFFFRRNLRMSHQDLVDEHKQTEGDPHVKQHRRQQHRSLLESSLNRVSKAKLVVNNPTHISVALDYEPGVHDLPFILAMETDDMALLMRRMAVEQGIPLVTHIPLARALFQDGEVDAYIPSTHVALAAEVFRQVLSQLRESPDVEEPPAE